MRRPSNERLVFVCSMLATATAIAIACAASLLWPRGASAGACPVCESAADCESPSGGPVFCVLHDGDVGCGDARQICCPGQGCAITGAGRPSCEGTSCTVVDGPEADAGMADVDGGLHGDDAGTIGPIDGGGGATDSGLHGDDAGTAGSGRHDGGCGCRVAAGRREGSAGAGDTLAAPGVLSLLGGVALTRGRRRRARRRGALAR